MQKAMSDGRFTAATQLEFRVFLTKSATMQQLWRTQEY